MTERRTRLLFRVLLWLLRRHREDTQERRELERELEKEINHIALRIDQNHG